MTRKEKAIKNVLEEPYLSKTTIMLVLSCSKEDAERCFKECKEIERAKEKFDIRPNRVKTNIFLKVSNTDYNFLLKQYKTKKGGAINELWTSAAIHLIWSW